MLYVVEILPEKLKIVFSSVVANVTEVIEDTTTYLKSRKCIFDSFSLKLALAEGLTNALKHGNSMNPNLYVTFSLDLSHEKMILTFEDQGEGFDWKKVIESGLPGNEAVSGRGIFLMENYGFKVKYNSKGNTLILVQK